MESLKFTAVIGLVVDAHEKKTNFNKLIIKVLTGSHRLPIANSSQINQSHY